MLSLIVKGRKADAMKAAEAAHVAGVQFVLEIPREHSTETVLFAPDAERPHVSEWFHGETGDAPFKMGTLLVFSQLEEAHANAVLHSAKETRH